MTCAGGAVGSGDTDALEALADFVQALVTVALTPQQNQPSHHTQR